MRFKRKVSPNTETLFSRNISLFLFYFISMSLFYNVMGAARCPKIKKHAGIKLRPTNKSKEPYNPGEVLIYSCESTEFTQSIKCLDDGRWSELPHCPDPTNSTCPELGPIQHGSHNASGQLKVGTIVAFKCDEEFLNLTGHRLTKCLPSSKWSHPIPSCLAEQKSNLSLILTSTILILIPILILVTIIQLFTRWRRKQQQRERWKQYFTDYKYRHSKTSITFGARPQTTTTSTIPITDL